jgi:hypothetical protein
MRLIDVVLGGVLLGLIVGLLQMAQPSAAGASPLSERITWLWTPALTRRTSAIQ